VITGNDDDLVAKYAILQSGWKTLQKGATSIALNDWIKFRILYY
jgi:hypothetical protein